METTHYISLINDPRLNIWAFHRQVLSDGAGMGRAYHKYGLLGYLVDDSTWAALPGNTTVGEDGNNVIEPRPSLDEVPMPEVQTANSLKVMEMRVIARAKSLEYLAIILSRILPSISREDKEAMANPALGVLLLNERQILEWLVQRHGKLNATDIQCIHSQLHAQCDQPFAAVQALHSRLHLALIHAGQGIPESSKVTALRASTAHRPSIAAAITAYLIAFPDIYVQSFESMCAFIIAQEPNFVSSSVSALGFSAVSTPPNLVLDSVSLELKQLRELMTTFAGAASARPGKQRRNYCFVHGYDGHAGKKCLVMAADRAKFTQAMVDASMHTSVVPNGSSKRV
jgi:hypothetical protein